VRLSVYEQAGKTREKWFPWDSMKRHARSGFHGTAWNWDWRDVGEGYLILSYYSIFYFWRVLTMVIVT